MSVIFYIELFMFCVLQGNIFYKRGMTDEHRSVFEIASQMTIYK